MSDEVPGPGPAFPWGRFFTAAERVFMIAICDRLIPASALGPGAIQTGIPQFIDRHMASPYALGELWYRQGPFIEASKLFGYQGPLSLSQILREGIRETDEHCRCSYRSLFAQLTVAEQETVMRQLEGGELQFRAIDSARFFTMLLAEVRMGYFADPVHGANIDMGSWEMIGYPGFPGDYREAIRERAKPYAGRTQSLSEAGR